MTSKAEKFWDFLARGYDRTPDDPSGREDLEAILRYLHPDDVVLEFACGTGTLAIELAGRVREIQAIDISSRMLAIAAAKASKRQVENIRFSQATIFDEVLGMEAYDVVMAFNILHLLENTPAVLQRIHTLLKPGGIFISSTPCLGERTSFIRNILFSFLLLPGKAGIIPPIRAFPVDELRQLIRGSNFNPVQTNIFYDEAPSFFMIAKKPE
jgi:2-polyprenyl-3-methyl-5-hydroxy-6-metoxy-1,4-benzoquinol methylase